MQAGSYALMDTAYAALGLPFGQALIVLATVISVNPPAGQSPTAGSRPSAWTMVTRRWSMARRVFCSDEHVIFSPPEGGSLPQWAIVRVLPAHVDPTMAYHERVYVFEGDQVLEVWPMDLRGW